MNMHCVYCGGMGCNHCNNQRQGGAGQPQPPMDSNSTIYWQHQNVLERLIRIENRLIALAEKIDSNQESGEK